MSEPTFPVWKFPQQFLSLLKIPITLACRWDTLLSITRDSNVLWPSLDCVLPRRLVVYEPKFL